MEIKLNSNLIKDTDICIDIKKVGQEFCAPNKSPTNCVRPSVLCIAFCIVRQRHAGR